MWSEADIKPLHDAMFFRKSVRKFKSEPLDDEMLEGVMQKTTALFSPLEDAAASFRILNDKQIKGIVTAKAPHFLAVYAGPDPNMIINAACMLQQMDLWFSANGIGSCWLGMPRPVPEAAEADGLPYAILLAFGRPAEELHRKDIDQFKRKSISEITDLPELYNLLEPVRLSPSARNRQPWFFTGGGNAVKINMKQSGFIVKALYGDMPFIDIGISLCHLWLSSLRRERFGYFSIENTDIKAPDGYRCLWTLNLEPKDSDAHRF